MSRKWWAIFVGGGYGEFGYYGTEREAEEMRAHKAQWEEAVARKRVIQRDDALAESYRERIQMFLAEGRTPDEREREAVAEPEKRDA